MNKSICISIFLILYSLTLSAQKISLHGGINFANMDISGVDEGEFSTQTKSKVGGQMGMRIAFPVYKSLFIETGLTASTKGYKIHESYNFFGYETEVNSRLNAYYLELPLNIKGVLNVGKINIYGAFGPYFAMGIYGNYRTKSTFDGETEVLKGDVSWGTSADDELKRPDGGINFGAGMEYKRLVVGIVYSHGLLNISNVGEIKNRVFSVTVGCKLGKME
ncbi:MAG: PorT family protein [Bacteroidetes bacterium]|nr:PorT family protein [Bacteroidota bacterium]